LDLEVLGLYSLWVNPALRSMLPILSLVMGFLGNVFTNFIFEKLLSHEAPVMERVTATSYNQRSFVTGYKSKIFVRAI